MTSTYEDIILVLDEADRMLDMGFAKDLNFILSKVPRKRQSLLFSATMSLDIRHLAIRQMVNPKEILVSKDEPVLDLTKQYYFIADKETKRDVLCTILDKSHPKAIVFCATKRKVDQLTKKLLADNYPAGADHGDVAQNKRERVIKAFKDGSVMISGGHGRCGTRIGHRRCGLCYQLRRAERSGHIRPPHREDRKGGEGRHRGSILHPGRASHD